MLNQSGNTVFTIEVLHCHHNCAGQPKQRHEAEVSTPRLVDAHREYVDQGQWKADTSEHKQAPAPAPQETGEPTDILRTRLPNLVTCYS
jgi:hypothetical protein